MKSEPSSQPRLRCAAGSFCAAQLFAAQSAWRCFVRWPCSKTGYSSTATVPRHAGCHCPLMLMLPARCPCDCRHSDGAGPGKALQLPALLATSIMSAGSPCAGKGIPNADAARYTGLACSCSLRFVRTTQPVLSTRLHLQPLHHVSLACPFAGVSTAVPDGPSKKLACPFAGLSTAESGGPSKLACVSRYFCTR